MSDFMEQANRTPVTLITLLAYFTLAFATGMFGGDDEMFGRRLIEYGADRPSLVREGELWRLVTHSYLHGGLMHLLLNSYFLFLIGSMLEQSIGSVRFATIYLVTAIGGGLNGNLWHEPHVTLVGGSGALFGMLGAMLALHVRQGRHALDFLRSAAARSLLTLIGINLAIGLLFPFISNAAHVGGLIAGFALTFYFLDHGRDGLDRAGRMAQAGWAALFLSLIFYSAQPVVRWDYLADRMEDITLTTGERAGFARALLLRTDDLRSLGLPEGQRVELLFRVREIARGR